MNIESLDIWSLLIIIMLAQGFFVLSLMLIKKQVSHQNTWLFLLVLVFIWLQAEFLAIRYPYNTGINVFYGTRYGSWLVIGPLYYFYIASIGGAKAPKSQVALHLAPFVIFTLLIPGLTSGFLNFRQVHYGMLTPFDTFGQEVSLVQYFYSTIFISQFLHLLIYIVLANKKIKGFKEALKLQYSNYDVESYQWLRIMNIVMYIIFAFATMFISLLFLFTDIYRRHHDYIYVLPMSVAIYLVSYKLSGVKWHKADDPLPRKYEKSSLKQEEAKAYAAKLQKYFHEHRPYLNNELRLKDIADELKVPSYHLSQVINKELHTTFFDFVNKHRIETAKSLIEQKPEASMLQVAFDSGFNNKTSFVNSFKKFAGTTPSTYRQQSVPTDE